MKRCRWCGETFAIRPGSGRPRKYCKRSHRQRHYESKRLTDGCGLEPDGLLIETFEIDDLRDRFFAFEAACEDIETDLEADGSLAAHKTAVAKLLAVARPILEIRSAFGDRDLYG